ncbi:hypothetical protein [Halobaculum litoreum]|uniref:Uncharacterized protein n=1 Tax=Halobaculum litoreum TaxID=3031998 RepID=A0ABD5XNU9_9EURY|nr:hypothetical protein [Halobaculum sp. DT92]
MSAVRRALLALVGTPAGLAALAAVGGAHPDHATPTPAGPLAGLSAAGVGVGIAGLVVLTGAVLLAHEGVLDERSRSAGVGVGAGLVVAGAAVAVVLP